MSFYKVYMCDKWLEHREFCWFIPPFFGGGVLCYPSSGRSKTPFSCLSVHRIYVRVPDSLVYLAPPWF